MLAAGQADDDVGAHAAIGVGALIVCCSSKSQCSSIPASSMTRFSCSSPQRPRTPGRLSASTSRPVWLRRSWPVVSSDAMRCDQRRARLDAAAFGLLDLAVDLLQRFRHRREQVLDRLFAGVDIGGRFSARLAQPRFGEIEKRPIVGVQRLGGQRLECLAQLRFGFVVGLEPLGVDRRDRVRGRFEAAHARDGRPAIRPMHRWRDQSSE